MSPTSLQSGLAISHDTRVTLALVAAIVVTGITSTWAIATKLSRIEERLAKLEMEKYTVAAASEQALRMAIENPGFSVPDPRDPNQQILVRPGRPGQASAGGAERP